MKKNKCDLDLNRSYFNMVYGMILYTEILIFMFIYIIEIFMGFLMRLRL